PCSGSAFTRNSSEKRISFIDFIATNGNNGNNPFNCQWLINGPAGKSIYLALNYLTIGGDCSQSNITFTLTKNVTTICNKNITSDLPLHISTGYATINFHSEISFPHAFKVSFKSYIE
ncbi:Hypothetical predicted protein, partial [Mytilus galloprovincialis]